MFNESLVLPEFGHYNPVLEAEMKGYVNPNLKIDSLRQNINEIDAALLNLLAERRELCREAFKSFVNSNPKALPCEVKACEINDFLAPFPDAEEPSSQLLYHSICEDLLTLKHQCLATISQKSPQKPVTSSQIGRTCHYSLNTRKERTTVQVGHHLIGDGCFTYLAGPERVESSRQIHTFAGVLFDSGIDLLTVGCCHFRTSAKDSFDLGFKGLSLLRAAGESFNLPTATEVHGVEDLEYISQNTDLLIVSPRNMQNFSLLIAVGKIGKPVMLQRGTMASIEEFLNAAEYILAQGNPDVILCDCGIRTFECVSTYTLDLGAVPTLKSRTHLPVIVAPSASITSNEFLPSMISAAKAVGADGVLIELTKDVNSQKEEKGMSLEQFSILMADLRPQKAQESELRKVV